MPRTSQGFCGMSAHNKDSNRHGIILMVNLKRCLRPLSHTCIIKRTTPTVEKIKKNNIIFSWINRQSSNVCTDFYSLPVKSLQAYDETPMLNGIQYKCVQVLKYIDYLQTC